MWFGCEVHLITRLLFLAVSATVYFAYSIFYQPLKIIDFDLHLVLKPDTSAILFFSFERFWSSHPSVVPH